MQPKSITQLSAYSAILISTLSITANALGINCQGNSKCDGRSSSTAYWLNNYIQQLSDDAWYNNGQAIACYQRTICAFLQNTGGANGKVIKQLAPYITGHGCTVCGSVPYYYPQGDNNIADGELTFNYYANPCVDSGLCY